MRQAAIWGCVCLLLLLVTGDSRQTVGQDAAKLPPRYYALLVGVQEYDPNELRSLPYAEPDVEVLSQLLIEQGFRRVVLMTQTVGAKQFRSLPTSGNIRKTLKGLLANKREQDVVLIALAGHGVQFKGEAEAYFCPMDAKLNDRKTLISLKELYAALEACEAGTRLLLVDACRNDPQSDNSRSAQGDRVDSITRPQTVKPPGGVAALFSCSAGQKAFESSELKHGIFFHAVIEGLRGKADFRKQDPVTWDELVAWTRAEVPDLVADIYGDGVRQDPELTGRMRGNIALLPAIKLPDQKMTAPTKPVPTRPVPTKSPGNISTGRKLYVLGIGISEYDDPTVERLYYAHKDASEVCRVFKEYGKNIFTDIKIRQLTNKQATKKAILDGLKWLREEMTDNDIAVVLYSGQGAEDEDFGGFFFLPSDIDDEQISDRGISADLFMRAFAEIPGRLIVLLDAHLTGATSTELSMSMNKYIKKKSGVHMILCTEGQSISGESHDLKHGYFSYVVLEGLKGKANDHQFDTVVTDLELQSYVRSRLKQLTKNKQVAFAVGNSITRAIMLTEDRTNN